MAIIVKVFGPIEFECDKRSKGKTYKWLADDVRPPKTVGRYQKSLVEKDAAVIML